jgi:hypothetical protein
MFFLASVVMSGSITKITQITPELFYRLPKDMNFECNQFRSKHRFSINRPTKRGKEKYPSDGHCQCQKEMDEHSLACQQILEKKLHSDTPC